MSAPAGLVLLPPYRDNTGKEAIDYSEEEEGSVQHEEEEEEELEIILEQEARFDTQGNSISELKYTTVYSGSIELVIFPLQELLYSSHVKLQAALVYFHTSDSTLPRVCDPNSHAHQSYILPRDIKYIYTTS